MLCVSRVVTARRAKVFIWRKVVSLPGLPCLVNGVSLPQGHPIPRAKSAVSRVNGSLRFIKNCMNSWGCGVGGCLGSPFDVIRSTLMILVYWWYGLSSLFLWRPILCSADRLVAHQSTAGLVAQEPSLSFRPGRMLCSYGTALTS